MALADDIREIREGISTNRYEKEADVSQGIILRILQRLGWPTFDTRVVMPEYSVEGSRVDYALCHPRGKPVVFIEAKRIGEGEGADRQLFEYAFHIGVPMAVMTDGKEWHFYLPGEQGRYDERRVYKLDLLAREVEECAERFERYLAYSRIGDGSALEQARRDYRDVSRARRIRDTIPDAWKSLIERPDELLQELLAEEVESLCGYRPNPDQIVAFLSTIKTGDSSPGRSVTRSKRQSRSASSRRSRNTVRSSVSTNRYGVRAGNQFIKVESKSAIGVLKELLNYLHQEDKGFLERFAKLPKHGRKRRYVARSKADLYPGREDLQDKSHKLEEGWWLGTNYSKRTIKKIAELAIDTAQLPPDQKPVEIVIE